MKNNWKIELYRLDVSNSQFIKIDVIESYRNLTFFFKKNNYGAASFELSIQDSKATRDNLRRYSTIVAFKFNKTIVWVGHIDHVKGNYDDVSGTLVVQCLEYFEKLNHFYAYGTTNFVNEDQGDIAKTLIETATNKTNGFLGISVPTFTATVDRDRTYEDQNIGEAIVNLTRVENGFDFFLDPVLDSNNNLSSFNFNIFENYGSERKELNPVRVGVSANQFSFAVQDEVVNFLKGISDSSGENKFSTTTSNDPSQLSYGRREDLKKYYNIKIKQTLNDKVQEVVDDLKGDKFDLECRLKPDQYGINSFRVGDSLNVQVEEGYMDYSGFKEVKEISYEVDDAGQFFIDVKFNIDNL